jgi:hypothetical protein
MTAVVPHDRIQYVSDNPYAPPEVSNVFAAHLDTASLSTELAAAINCDNAVKLFPRLASKGLAA